MIAIVAFRMASSTTADMFGGVSMKTHSMPSRLAAATIPATELTAVLIGGSLVPRRLCHNVNEPRGSASISTQGVVDLWACRAELAATGLLPLPPFRDAETMTLLPLPPHC